MSIAFITANFPFRVFLLLILFKALHMRPHEYQTGKRLLTYCKHYRKQRVCRVPQSLPRATSRAHSKQLFWHVSLKKCTAKVEHTMCFFGTRQSIKFFVCFFSHGKVIKISSLLNSKLFLLFTYKMLYSMLKFGTFLYLLAIFN